MMATPAATSASIKPGMTTALNQRTLGRPSFFPRDELPMTSPISSRNVRLSNDPDMCFSWLASQNRPASGHLLCQLRDGLTGLPACYFFEKSLDRRTFAETAKTKGGKVRKEARGLGATCKSCHDSFRVLAS
jgi:hypothetical protein